MPPSASKLRVENGAVFSGVGLERTLREVIEVAVGRHVAKGPSDLKYCFTMCRHVRLDVKVTFLVAARTAQIHALVVDQEAQLQVACRSLPGACSTLGPVLCYSQAPIDTVLQKTATSRSLLVV